MLPIEKRYEKEAKMNEILVEQLKQVARALEQSNIEQPSQCFFKDISCGYPIDDCYNCPMHEWSDFTMPLTSCEFK